MEFRCKEGQDIYKVGFAFKQSYVTDGLVYRNLKIDGKTPFYEGGDIPICLFFKMAVKEFKDEEGNRINLIYLTAGASKLSLSVTLSDTAEVFKRLKEVVSALGRSLPRYCNDYRRGSGY